ncbi:hypothetical protein BX666DRAFT_1966004 [Dichotomocladium elegans]|nr:hypothetical protein BX666DRAFT_1966004 [Dichotomocladium elegans]
MRFVFLRWAPVYLADPDHAAVLTALKTMDFPLDSLAQRNRRVRLISAILQAVWTAHWAHIFDSTPMTSTATTHLHANSGTFSHSQLTSA